MSDDHASKAVSAYDSSLIKTPNIDRLAKEGIKFTNANVTNALCAPSRAVMLTGKYSHINGLRDNSDTFNSNQMTWVKLLQKSGYATSIFGKWHLKTVPQGFDYWDILVGQGDYYDPRFITNGDTSQVDGYVTNLVMNKALERLKNRDQSKPFAMVIQNKAPHRTWMPELEDLDMYSNRNIPLPETFFDSYTTRSAAAREQDMRIMDMALSYDLKMHPKYFANDNGLSDIQTERRYFGKGTAGGDPGFDAVKAFKGNYNRLSKKQKKIWDAHYDSVAQAFERNQPSGTALAYWKYQRYMKDYLRTIASVDDNVGRLLDYLDKSGLAKNTIVVYTSDQGFFLGEHGWFDKRFMYEPSMKIPLLVQYPKEIKAGRTSDKLVMNTDFAPTFIDEAGLQISKAMQGKSMQPIFRNNVENWRESIYYHYYEFSPDRGHRAKKHYGIKTNRYKLIHFYDDIDAWELYDLKADSQELNNLYGISAYKTLADSLKNELRQLQIKFQDTSFKESLVK